MDGPPSARAKSLILATVLERSCIRPVYAANAMPLALRGIADRVPVIPARFVRDDTAECPDPGPDRFAVIDVLLLTLLGLWPGAYAATGAR